MSVAEEYGRDLGHLEGRVDAIEKAVARTEVDVKEILKKMNQAEGSWKFLLGLATIAGGVGAVVSWLASHLTR